MALTTIFLIILSSALFIKDIIKPKPLKHEHHVFMNRKETTPNVNCRVLVGIPRRNIK